MDSAVLDLLDELDGGTAPLSRAHRAKVSDDRILHKVTGHQTSFSLAHSNNAHLKSRNGEQELPLDAFGKPLRRQ
jgi:hypothetical protein